MRTGRPLRFLLVVTGGWTAMRAVMLWPGWMPDVAAETLAPPAMAAATPAERQLQSGDRKARDPQFAVSLLRAASQPLLAHRAGRAPAALQAATLPAGMPALRRPSPSQSQLSPPLATGVPVALLPHRASRWSGSFWLVARGGSGVGSGFTGPQLGGSQAGLRIAYALDQHLGIAARVASPLGSGQRDAAIGLEWRPTRLPVRLVAEERFTLGPGRGGPAIGVIGGFGPVAVTHGLRAEGYGQAGYIARGSGGEGFADGAVRLSHPLGDLAHVRFDLGASAWGAAQKGASRLDLGPSLGAIIPLRRQPVRLALEWRQRAAGNATPASGPALSLGMDF